MDETLACEPTEEQIRKEEELLQHASFARQLNEYLTVRVAAYIASRVIEVERRVEHRLRNERWIENLKTQLDGKLP